MSSNMSKELKLIPVANIQANKNQPRKRFDQEALEELAASIKAVGIIQPLSVRAAGNGQFILISGERRLRAAVIAGLDRVPCVIIQAGAEDIHLMAIVENIQREDLSFLEEANAYTMLIETYNFTQSQLAEKVGKRQSTISNKLRLLKLGEEVLSLVVENNLSERHARALLQIPDTETRIRAIETIAKKELNVRQSEELVEKLKAEVVLDASRNTNLKNVFNYRIYTNTIKQAFETICKTGIDAGYDETAYEDRVEVKIIIPIEK
ncbi:MAG: ParB/RepB/Spo0J family partition protein [Eubacteriaceae bacterium]|nr:ParB/RepB/Spo0J family partition protein [Eubacteriaceae bacterium]